MDLNIEIEDEGNKPRVYEQKGEEIIRKLDRLEKWAQNNGMKFNRD